MLALSIRQPYAELILRGIKTIEFRSRPTRRIGERFYIYAAKAKAKLPVWSDDLAVPGTNTGGPPLSLHASNRTTKHTKARSNSLLPIHPF